VAVAVEQFTKASAMAEHLVVRHTEPVLLRVVEQSELQQPIPGIRGTAQFALIREETQRHELVFAVRHQARHAVGDGGSGARRHRAIDEQGCWRRRCGLRTERVRMHQSKHNANQPSMHRVYQLSSRSPGQFPFWNTP